MKKIIYPILFFLFLFKGKVFACSDHLKNFSKECEIQDQYNDLVKGFRDSGINLHPEFLAKVRALRFIAKWDFSPPKDEDFYLVWDIYRPKPTTWLKWDEGNHFRHLLKEELTCQYERNGSWNFKKEYIQNLHKNTLTRDLTGPLDKIPLIGRIRFPAPGEYRSQHHQRNGFSVKKRWFNNWETKEFVQEKFDKFKNQAVNFDLYGIDGKPLIDYSFKTSGFNKVKYKIKGKFEKATIIGEIKYLESKKVDAEMDSFLKELNDGMAELLLGNKAKIKVKNKFREVTPYEFASYIQRKYVSIHPFHEGNGRMSRFLQDIVLESLGLPVLPGGLLQDDVINTHANYSKQTYDSMGEKLGWITSCLEEYKTKEKVSLNCAQVYNWKRQESVSSRWKKTYFRSYLFEGLLEIRKSFPFYNCLNKDQMISEIESQDPEIGFSLKW